MQDYQIKQSSFAVICEAIRIRRRNNTRHDHKGEWSVGGDNKSAGGEARIGDIVEYMYGIL
jgi:hypothetical protein